MTTPATIRSLEADVGALVAEHRAARGLQDFAKYRDDPVAFLRDVLHWQPWSRQEEIAGLVRDCPLVAVRSANGIGKDALAARLALWWVFARGGLALLTGPSERQSRREGRSEEDRIAEA